jgi:hypothetical protein
LLRAKSGSAAAKLTCNRQQRLFLNVIRLLANDLEIPLVCAGPPEARRALLTDGGLADRFEWVELPRWVNNLAFRRFLCAGHIQQLEAGGPLCNMMEVKHE